MKTAKYGYGEIICAKCGNIVIVSEWQGSRYRLFSSRKFSCYKCKKLTTHYYIKDKEYAKRKILDYDIKPGSDLDKVYKILYKEKKM